MSGYWKGRAMLSIIMKSVVGRVEWISERQSYVKHYCEACSWTC